MTQSIPLSVLKEQRQQYVDQVVALEGAITAIDNLIAWADKTMSMDELKDATGMQTVEVVSDES